MSPESLQIESPEKEVATKSYEEILEDVGASGVDALQEVVDDLNPKWEGTKYFHKVLEELREAERKEAERRASLNRVGEVSAEEVEETWQALHEDLAKPEEDEFLTKEKSPWAFEEEKTEEKKQNRIQKIWEDIKKLFK